MGWKRECGAFIVSAVAFDKAATPGALAGTDVPNGNQNRAEAGSGPSRFLAGR